MSRACANTWDTFHTGWVGTQRLCFKKLRTLFSRDAGAAGAAAYARERRVRQLSSKQRDPSRPHCLVLGVRGAWWWRSLQAHFGHQDGGGRGGWWRHPVNGWAGLPESLVAARFAFWRWIGRSAGLLSRCSSRSGGAPRLWTSQTVSAARHSLAPPAASGPTEVCVSARALP